MGTHYALICRSGDFTRSLGTFHLGQLRIGRGRRAFPPQTHGFLNRTLERTPILPRGRQLRNLPIPPNELNRLSNDANAHLRLAGLQSLQRAHAHPKEFGP